MFIHPWPHWSVRLQATPFLGVQPIILPCQLTSSEDRIWEWLNTISHSQGQRNSLPWLSSQQPRSTVVKPAGKQ